MSDLARTIRCWHTRGEPYALATVTAVSGSTPRELGPAFAVDADVYELCLGVLDSGLEVRRRFDPDGQGEPFAPQLPCGGSIEVAVRRVDPHTDPLPIDEQSADERPRLLIFGAVQFADALATAGKFL